KAAEIAAAEAESKRMVAMAEVERLEAFRAQAERLKAAEAEAKSRVAEVKWVEERRAALAETNRRLEQAERQRRRAAFKAEQERQAAEQDGRFSLTNGMAVAGTHYKFLNTKTVADCSSKCAADTQCKMFAYWNNSICYLFDQNFSTRPNSESQVGAL